MANDAIKIEIPKLVIEGYNVRQLICKNDNCRRILGYERMKIGVVILFCPSCDMASIFNASYSKMARDFDKVKDETMNKKGGE